MANKLPVAMCWNTGAIWHKYPTNRADNYRTQWHPNIIKQMIEDGYPVLPMLQMTNPPEISGLSSYYTDIVGKDGYYEDIINFLKARGLPVILQSTQLDGILLTDTDFTSLGIPETPRVIDNADGVTLVNNLDPLSPTQAWYDCGTKWALDPTWQYLANLYPDPPYLQLTVNNEAARHSHINAENSKRFVDLYGTGYTNFQKAEIYGDHWRDNYQALIAGLRNNLPSVWKDKIKFSGYATSPMIDMGRWAGWDQYSLWSPDREIPWYDVWDGIRINGYASPGNKTDYNGWAVQICMGNLYAQLKRLKQESPNTMIEADIWDGVYLGEVDEGSKTDYEDAGQSWSPERYKGFVRFIMWATRLRSYAEFRGHVEELTNYMPYWKVFMDCHKEVWDTPVLKDWWQNATIYENTSNTHIYQSNIPPEIASDNRWLQLECSTNPTTDRAVLSTIWPVFAVGFTKGSEFLVYAQAPVTEQSSVTITTPNGDIIVDIPRKGRFFIVNSGGAIVQEIN